MRTFEGYLAARKAASLPRWQYVLHLAETKSGPEIAKLMGISRQRVYQIVDKAKAHNAQAASRNGASS